MQSDPAICRALVKRDADVFAEDTDGQTPLHLAESVEVSICAALPPYTRRFHAMQTLPLPQCFNPQCFKYFIRSPSTATQIAQILLIQAGLIIVGGASMLANKQVYNIALPQPRRLLHCMAPYVCGQRSGQRECSEYWMLNPCLPVTTQDKHGYAPLHAACGKSTDLVKLLLSHGTLICCHLPLFALRALTSIDTATPP